MFFSFQLALPKTSVLLLCQHNSRFLTFFILFFALCPFPLLLGHFARCHLKFCPLFSYSRLFHSLSCRGGTRSFAMSICFNSRFLTFFILFFIPLPFFPLLLGHFARCHLKFCPLFSYSRLFHSLSFWGGTRSFSMSVCFNSRFLTFLCIAFCPFAFCRLLFGHFALCPLQFSK